MAAQMQNKAENKGLYKADIYEEFIEWYALPSFEKRKRGISDQTEFAEAYGINKDTLTRWKNRRDFEPYVKEHKQKWTRGRTSDVIEAIYRSAMKGSARAQKMWLTLFEDFGNKGNKKEQVVEKIPLFDTDDVRHLISYLPEDLQKKYNSMLDDLIADVRAMDEGRYDDMTNNPNRDGL